MRVLIFGATGMVGQGVLRAALMDPGVEIVQTIGRTPTGAEDRKLRELIHPDLFHFAGLEQELSGFDACFFCLGVSSAGMAEEEYRRVTYDIAMAAAGTLSRLNPQMTFIFVSGAGTDSTEKGRLMWARVKGATENALMRLPFGASYMFRPGFIQPVHGARSKTELYRFLYMALRPLLPVLRRILPSYVLTTEELGLAMLRVARVGYARRVLETRDIRAVLTI
ncbi:Rossmann-fold NAD(P)-binding domain-containing protein [Paludibaculum fermentans]|uniref:Epimerase n=1 Tax=Paludibaculum fermentans TaxID=1473598 RepID=A0A7S7SKI0_PALFE|nr:epimerase [Paludibaculum fermentans]QOY88344.1 epimerase [Paludibaculum fermentans]